MMRRTSRMRSAAARGLFAAVLSGAVYAPAHAHVRLDTATPAAGAELAESPPQLRLLFSGFIERSYTSVTVTAPDGERVATGPVVFVADSDREFTLSVPPLVKPGVYTVAWRTAGADGHVLEGSYSFTVLESAIDDPTVTDAADSAVAPTVMETHDHDDTGHDQEMHAASGAPDVAGRFLHFAALMLLVGALSFRLLLLPRVVPQMLAASGIVVVLRRRVWQAMVVGALMLAGAAVLRLWLQSTALHGADRAWSSPLLSMMLTDTSWGRAWVLQAFLFAVLGAAIAWARPHRDSLALWVAVPAVIGLAAIPGMSGHAAAVTGFGYAAVVNDTVHVVAVGTWIGTLFVLAVAGLPTLLHRGAAPVADAALAVNAFSPIALTAAAVAVATGTINALMHFDALAQITGTEYGRMLLIKTGLVALVLTAGFVNWRVLRPRLHQLNAVRRLRFAAGAELGLAGLVILATALLTGLPRP